MILRVIATIDSGENSAESVHAALFGVVEDDRVIVVEVSCRHGFEVTRIKASDLIAAAAKFVSLTAGHCKVVGVAIVVGVEAVCWDTWYYTVDSGEWRSSEACVADREQEQAGQCPSVARHSTHCPEMSSLLINVGWICCSAA